MIPLFQELRHLGIRLENPSVSQPDVIGIHASELLCASRIVLPICIGK
jgi:hypothetical protein